ncbi:MAG TPA: glycoside hydrolase family 44 protein [Vicinamibacteria bacterium]|nr:glycoside hydrolase family 44 protein [Vicinamibacteria bacterium]
MPCLPRAPGLPPSALLLAVLLSGPAAAFPADLTVAVDPSADRRPVSPLVFGVNFASRATLTRMRYTANRWGGNSTTRYSWVDDTSNRASDWFFFNIPEDNSNPSALPDGSSADLFVDDARAAGAEPLLTVGTIGWTPKDRAKRWGYSVAKYGAQQQTECMATGGASWCQPDAGNGHRASDGAWITGNDPTDTSRAVDPTFVTGWMGHLATRAVAQGHSGVHLFALDNEPALWNDTHHDVFPSPLTYDQYWTWTQAYGAAIKAKDPTALVFGPVEWGWCAYFFSPADNCNIGSDRLAHGNLEFIDWYLKQAKQYYDATGVRLVDYLDVHYYPQSQGVSLSDDESATTQALRLRSLKSLYDPAYVDESWIGTTGYSGGVVRLVPRLRDWIASRFPGTKIAITEYSWGGDTGSSSTLAQAEALAIFAREGVDFATRWVAPADNSPIEDAFSLYLNYDASGGRVQGQSVRAASSNVDEVGSYAILSPSNVLYLLLFNKDTVARTAAVTVAGGLPPSFTLYRFSSSSRLASAGTATPSSGELDLTLPARSATLAVGAFASSSAPLAFHTLTPCRAVDTRNATGTLGGPALAAGAARTFALAGQCAIPASAQALSINVTVTAPTAAGYVVVYPGGGLPPATSTLNFAVGATRANNAVVGLGKGAALAARSGQASGTVHLIVDVNGYFE